MLIEALAPLRIRLPERELSLVPGCPVNLPDTQAKRLLERAKGKVRALPAPDWLSAWRELASLTYGIGRDDPRFESVMVALHRCDDAYLSGDWAAFQSAAQRVKEVVAGNEKA